MEFIVYIILTALLWVIALTVFLPFTALLKYSKTFRNKWFPFIYVYGVLFLFGRYTRPFRKRCFEMLKENLPNRSKSKCIKILEIGIGSGANLPFYPENSALTSVDVNPSFREYFFKNRSRYPHIEYERAITCMAEDMSEIEDSSMDVVVTSYVLCYVNDIRAVLCEIRRVLKPDGKYLYMEHFAFPRKNWGYLVQKLIAPLWFIYSDGCCIDRDIPNEIRKAGFSNIVCEEKYPFSIPLCVRPHVLGIATVCKN
ncbi:Methyltransferase-like protein 7B, partial [Stegodyphus mimosarum]